MELQPRVDGGFRHLHAVQHPQIPGNLETRAVVVVEAGQCVLDDREAVLELRRVERVLGGERGPARGARERGRPQRGDDFLPGRPHIRNLAHVARARVGVLGTAFWTSAVTIFARFNGLAYLLAGAAKIHVVKGPKGQYGKVYYADIILHKT